MYKKVFFLLFIFYQSTGLCQGISLENAQFDLEELKSIILRHSSYFQFSELDLDQEIESIHSKFKSNDSIPIIYLHHEISKLIASIGDRHSRVDLPDSLHVKEKYANQFFPFVLAPLHDMIVVLKRIENTNQYSYLDNNYRYLKEIQGIDVYDLINYYPHRDLKAPKKGRLLRGSWYLESIAKHLFFEHKFIGDSITITMTNGSSDTIITSAYSSNRNFWSDIGSANPYYSKLSKEVWDNAEYRNLDRWLTDSIAYFRITDMLSYKRHPYFEAYLLNAIQKFRSAKAMIFDLRGNFGGTRHILNTLAPFLIPKEHSPWIANIAYIRNNQGLNEDIESMSARYLYPYDSENFTDLDRIAINSFLTQFNPEFNIPDDLFSKPYFMVLKSGDQQIGCPVYVLVSEESFSAATVFTASFKDLPNVIIAGVTTDGSSGRSTWFNLPKSGIAFKLSTMVSFQRNGKPLDGHGTEPEIWIDRTERQIFGYEDTQLNELIKIINNKN